METRNLSSDSDGMVIYDYIVNHIDTVEAEMPDLLIKLQKADNSGQFLSSTARFLHAVDAEKFSKWIPLLIENAIYKDRERRYISSLLEAIWGVDYKDRAEELKKTDDNFRRIYKRLYPNN